ncbi:MAG: two-component system sensor histidine kinase CreC [Arenicella sp.]|jgi:two-component system sensor histidine kinase CreC
MKMSYGLRAFAIYFVILGTVIWFTLDNAIERLNDGMRQSAESVILDIAHVLAAFIEDETARDDTSSALDKDSLAINSDQLKRVFAGVKSRVLDAQIYQVSKKQVDSQITITDHNGVVIYDSTGRHLGEDYSRWRDVKLTLEGKYGARTSYVDQQHTEPGDPKVMVIAAPIIKQGDIIGVISVFKPINGLEQHLLTESNQLKQYAFGLLMLALLIGYLLSLWFTYALNKIASYANAMAEGESIEAPMFLDRRLADLSASISNMRKQLDGKEYVENYIHSLTHELKTPITSIGGAVELLSEEMAIDDISADTASVEAMSVEDRRLFLNNIQTSNQRMSRLVDRMLSLAKLEGLTALVDTSEFDLLPSIERLVNERYSIIEQAQLSIIKPTQTSYMCVGDRVLLSQAIANLLDNAIKFCEINGQIEITVGPNPVNTGKGYVGPYEMALHNQGQPIPEFALPKIYDRFFSMPNAQANKSPSKSTGLGLSFVREMMKLHKGSVTVANTQTGVRATLRWPTQQ